MAKWVVPVLVVVLVATVHGDEPAGPTDPDVGARVAHRRRLADDRPRWHAGPDGSARPDRSRPSRGRTSSSGRSRSSRR